jgi:hypothetical protein
MGKIMSFVMYVLWVVTIGLVVATTLTDFKYEDLNLFALVFFVFSILNTFFVSTHK